MEFVKTLLNHTSLKIKLGFMGAVALMVVSVPTYRVWMNAKSGIDTVIAEQSGIEPLRQSMVLLRSVQLHRGQSSLLLNGKLSKDVVDGTAQNIESTLQKLSALPAVSASELTTKRIKAFGEGFKQLRSKLSEAGRTPSANFNEHTRLVQDVLGIQGEIANATTINLDPEAVTYYLYEANTLRLPPLLEKLALARGYGGMLLSSKNEVIRTETEIRMDAALLSIHADLDPLNVVFERSIAEQINNNDKEMADSLRVIQKDLLRDIDAAIRLGKKASLSDVGTMSPEDLFKSFTTVIDSGYAAAEKVTMLFGEELEQRKERLEQEKQRIIIAIALLTLLMIALGLGTYISISRPLSRALAGAARLGQGDFSDAGLQAEGSNETARLLQGLEAMRLQLAESIERERAIANENARIRGALDVASTNVMIADADYNIIYTNDSLKDMLRTTEADLRKELPQFNANEVIGRSIDQFHKHPAQQRGILDRLQTTHQATIKIGERTVSLMVTPVLNESKVRIGTVVEWQDQTEALAKQQAERKIAEENARIRIALDSVSSNVRIADNNGTVIYANHALLATVQRLESAIARQIPGFRSDGFVGMNICRLYADPDAALKRLNALETSVSIMMEIGGRQFEVTTTPVFSAERQRLGSISEWRDRTEELAAQDEIRSVIEATAAGNFNTKLNIEGKTGFFRVVAENLNRLIDTAADGLQEISTVLECLSHGDLTYQISKEYQGIFGELKENANRTVSNLAGLVLQISEATDAINTAAREIAQGNSNLSSRTEQQAASLEETASSMEELTSTVKQNADNARDANGLAVAASQVAAKGGQVVGQVVTTMAEINESARKIVDIIGVLDGIAFQTNILALNAAVEAARAGEQGRGFAVVASEVRNLAQRSATAAKEIKSLIGSSVERVNAGAKLVDQAGITMQEIVTSIKHVSDLVNSISAASNEQSSGIEEVNQAVTQMDENTQQNAALVEQAAAAAESLEEQANSLAEAVSSFRLNSAPVSKTTAIARPAPRAVAPRSPSVPSAPLSDEWEEF